MNNILTYILILFTKSQIKDIISILSKNILV